MAIASSGQLGNVFRILHILIALGPPPSETADAIEFTLSLARGVPRRSWIRSLSTPDPASAVAESVYCRFGVGPAFARRRSPLIPDMRAMLR